NIFIIKCICNLILIIKIIFICIKYIIKFFNNFFLCFIFIFIFHNTSHLKAIISLKKTLFSLKYLFYLYLSVFIVISLFLGYSHSSMSSIYYNTCYSSLIHNIHLYIKICKNAYFATKIN